MMKLYTLPMSPNSIKVVALAALLGQEVQLIPVDNHKGENRTPEYLSKNPNGLMPTLEDEDGYCLWESNAILQYLCDKAGNTEMLPVRGRPAAEAAKWMGWSAAHWGPALRPFLFERLVKKMMGKGDPDPAEIAKAEEALKKCGPVLEAQLSKHAFVLGEKLGVPDLVLAAPLVYMEAAQFPMQPFPHILAWYAKISALPQWQSALPQMAVGR